MINKVSIVQVLCTLSIGGSELLSRDIVISLHNKGYKCAICALDKGGQLEVELRSSGIQYKVINRMPNRYLLTMWQIYKYFNQIRPSIVHTHHLASLLHSFLGAKLVGAKIIHTEHESHSYIKKRRHMFLLRMLSIFCDKITTPNRMISDFFHNTVGISHKKLFTIPNGVNIEKFETAPHISKATVGLREYNKVVGTVGRLEAAKDHLTLLDAFKIVHETDKNVNLLIVGDGSLRRMLEKKCKDINLHYDVKFLGMRSDIPKLLSVMDVFVISSAEEGLPLALLEAMAAGKAIVATEVGGIGDVIKNNINGLLVNPRDPVDMAKAINKVLFDKEFAMTLGAAAKKTAHEKFNIDTIVSMYKELYLSS